MKDLKFGNLNAHLPAGAQIFDAIKYAILRMDLPPGQKISESDIADKFGASRTPVREALQQLRSVGLLMTKPSRGNYVTLLSRESILEARFLREAIEIANVTRVCKQTLPTDCRTALEENLANQQRAVDAHDERLFSELDDEFHFIVARATGYPRVAVALEREKVLLDRLRVLSLRDSSHLSALLLEHRSIYQALKVNDSHRAIQATRQHLQSILTTLSSLMDRHADYFEDTPPSSESA